MLKAYFDESGIHDGNEIVTLAGFVGGAAAWIALDAEWRAILVKNDLSYFHMTDCENGLGGFAKWKTAPEFRRSVVFDLARSIGRCRLYGYHASVVVSDWNAPEATPVREKFEHPYHLAFEHCLKNVAEWSCQFAGSEPVEFVMAQQAQYERVATDVYRRYINKKHHAPINALSFAPARMYSSLQAADALAYSVNKRLMSDLYDIKTKDRVYQVFWDRVSESEIAICEILLDASSLAEISGALRSLAMP